MQKKVKDIWNKLKNQYADNEEILDVLCAGENAAQKQTPKEPTEIRNMEFKGSSRPYYKSGHCPSCDTYVDTDDNAKFCPECGQALQWPAH
jgi:NADH pyrophosphatase NudC (nudix superfamily)